MKNISFILILSILAGSVPIFAIDEMFDFTNQYLPEKVEFEKKRKLCIFPFRYSEANKKFSYLSKGIPSVLLSGLNSLKFVFDEDVMAEEINYAYGKEASKVEYKPPNKKKAPDRNTIKLLNEGKLTILPSKDPRYIPLEMEIKEEKEPTLLESNLFVGRKYGCYYVITGEFQIQGEDSLFTTIEISFMRDGKTATIKKNSSVKRAFQEMNDAIEKIKKSLIKKDLIAFQIDTGDEKDVLVFVDGVYMGKTPFDKKEVLPSVHEIFLFKEGFLPEKLTTKISEKTSRVFKFTLKKIEGKGMISVVSDPKEADVYLGMTHLGKTPLKNIPVPVGSNQIRISKEDHVDYYKGVEIKKGETISVNAKLKSGDSEIYYKNKSNLFLDFSYYDFSLFSLFSTLFFYAGFIYADLRASQLSDEMKSQYAFASITQVLAFQSKLTNDEFLAMYAFQDVKIQKTRKEIKSWEKIGSNTKKKRLQGVAPAGVGIMLVLSIVFYWMGLDEETVEFGMKPILHQNPESAESYFRIHKRF